MMISECEKTYRFQHGEQLTAGDFPQPAGELTFELNPDGENPKSAVIAAIGGNFVLQLENLTALRVVAGNRQFLHNAMLPERIYSRIAVAVAGNLIRITVNGKNPLVIAATQTPAGKIVFGTAEKIHRLRGSIRNIVCGGFSGTIDIPEPPQEKDILELTGFDSFPAEVDLAGSWDFVLLPQNFSPDAPLPDKKVFTAQMAVPGYWDDHTELLAESDSFDRRAKTNPRFRPLTFPMGQITPDASMPYLVGTGYYRKNFRFAPGTLPGRVVLSLGPAVWGCAVYCNGKIAALNSGYSTATDCDLTELVDFNAVNTVVIAVSNFDRVFNCEGQANGQHIGLAVRGYQGMRGGIGGWCRLKFARACRIEDAYCHFDGSRLFCTAEVSGNGQVNWQLSGADGTVLRSGAGPAVEFDAAGLPRWDDETPELLTVTATLTDAEGKCSDQISFRYGLRTWQCAGAQLQLNGTPVYLRGTTEHHYFPETANAPFDKEKYLTDIRLWRSLGFNFLRFHTWCPPEPYLDAADECGMICQVEVPPHVPADEWERILKYLRRHACVGIICGGNEEAFTEFRINEVRELAKLTGRLLPGALFNPQEALARVEYRLLPDEPEVETEPFIHNPRKLAELAEFSDVYGSYNWGYFSYIFTEFPGAAAVDARCALYGKPLLSHEIGIMGGYLDFDNAGRYENCVVPPDLYVEARRNLTKHGLFDRAAEFFQLNSAFNNELRKVLFENIRSCRNISGFDFLGACDAHWHRCGYPCGMTDEFGRCRPGVTPENSRLFNAPAVLLADLPLCRAWQEKTEFACKISLSHFDKQPWTADRCQWQFQAGDFVKSGSFTLPLVAGGTVTEIGGIGFTLPAALRPVRAKLSVTGGTIYNEWDIWIFPEPESAAAPENYRETVRLDDDTIDFISGGGRVLLTDNFPADRMMEKFQCDTTGRSLGHLGTVIHRHRITDEMAHDGFAGLQFAGLLTAAASMDFTRSELPFNPLIEYIPSYKLVKRKTPLCEFAVGKGRLMMCGLNLSGSDPAAAYFHAAIRKYLCGSGFHAAPEVASELLKKLTRQEFADSGIAKTDEAWDPNVAAGKGVAGTMSDEHDGGNIR